MGKKYIYAFDLSMACSGISIFDEIGNPVKIYSVATNAKDSTGMRLKSLAIFILDLLKALAKRTKNDIDDKAVELWIEQAKKAGIII